MKSLKQYLTESVRSYKYKIKIAGDPSKNWMDMFCHNLQKFDPVQIGQPKSTPIQKDPYGFPDLKNQSVTIIDVEFKYPCTEPMVKQLARLLNYDENCVRMVQKDYDDGINIEEKQYANQASHSPLLNHEELEDSGKEASKQYAEQYMSYVRKSYEENKTEMPFAGTKTKAAIDSRAIPGNFKSPMTSITRQPKPTTGASASKSK